MFNSKPYTTQRQARLRADARAAKLIAKTFIVAKITQVIDDGNWAEDVPENLHGGVLAEFHKVKDRMQKYIDENTPDL